MKKMIALGAFALALGAAFGAVLTQARLAPQLAESQKRAQEYQDRVARLEIEFKEERLALQRQLGDLEQQRAALQNEVGVKPDEAAPAGQAAMEEVAEIPEEPSAKALNKKRPDRQASILPEETEAPVDEAAQEASRQEREERRRTFEDAIKQRVEGYLQDEAARATDADSQQRMQLLQQYAGEMMGLRTAMREAQTDEERQVLRDSMRETYGNIQQTLQEQQDSMLRNLASSNGITDTSKQDAFIAQSRELQSSPFFQADQLLGPAFGRGGFDGGRRGGRSQSQGQ